MRSLAHLSARVALGALTLAPVAASTGAQQPRLRSISRMEAEYPDPFTCIQWGSIRELSDGRVVVADPTEKRLEVIDLRRGTGTKIGREGSGPGEWAVPVRLIPLAGDTTLLFDPQNNRLLKILPNGTVAEQAVSLGTTSGPGMMGGLLSPRGYDRMGRVYSQGSGFVLTPGAQRSPADSAPITRFDIRTAKTDTVGYISTVRPQVQTSNSGGRQMTMVTINAPNPFAPQQSWAVLPDGRVGIVTPDPYRVEWIGGPGARTGGPTATYDRIRVTEADKTAPRSGPSCAYSITRGAPAGAAGAEVRATVGGGMRGGGGGAPPPRDDWPEFKPPFLSGQNTVVATPTGELWVLRARAANDEIPTYDVFDARGALVSRVALPKGGRLLGFGNGTVYLSRMDADDLVYIQRWRLDTP